MKMSPAGRDMIRRFEGVRCEAYQDPVGLWTIGVGHLLTRSELTSGKIRIGSDQVKWRDGLTDDQVDVLLAQDLAGAEAAVANLRLCLCQRQFDALVSWAFNIGEGAARSSTLWRELTALSQQIDQIAEVQLVRWVWSGGVKLPGLIARRQAEVECFTGRR